MAVPHPSGPGEGGATPPSFDRRPETSLLAVISLVAGVLGVFGAFFAPLLASIVAIVCGHLARSRIKRDPAQLTGDGVAVVGLVLGYLGIAISVAGLIFWGALFGVGIHLMYEIFRQIESGADGQWTELFRLLPALA
jgi:hypothetical protein